MIKLFAIILFPSPLQYHPSNPDFFWVPNQPGYAASLLWVVRPWHRYNQALLPPTNSISLTEIWAGRIESTGVHMLPIRNSSCTYNITTFCDVFVCFGCSCTCNSITFTRARTRDHLHTSTTVTHEASLPIAPQKPRPLQSKRNHYFKVRASDVTDWNAI